MDHYICDVGMFKQQKLSYVQPRIVGCHWYKESSQTSGSNKLQLSHDLWVRKMSFHSISNHGSFFPDRDCPVGICWRYLFVWFQNTCEWPLQKKRCPSNRMLRSLQWHGLSQLSAISLAALIWTTWTSWDSHPRTWPTGNCPHKSRRFAYSTWPWKPWQLRYQRWFPSSSPEKKNMLRHAGASDTFVWPSFLDILSAIQLAVVGYWSLAVKLLVVVVKPVKISEKNLRESATTYENHNKSWKMENAYKWHIRLGYRIELIE